MRRAIIDMVIVVAALLLIFLIVMVVIFGRQAECTGWPVVEAGAPPARLLDRVRHL